MIFLCQNIKYTPRLQRNLNKMKLFYYSSISVTSSVILFKVCSNVALY